MKFLIKTSAVGVSDYKSVPHGEYETTDRREIDRLKDLATRFPDDVEVFAEEKKDDKKKEEQKKDDKKDEKKSEPATPNA